MIRLIREATKAVGLAALASTVAAALPASVLHARDTMPTLYAQALVDRIVAEYPGLATVSIHSYAPGGAVNSSSIIAAKDLSKLGDPDDAEDFAALTDLKPNFYYSKGQGLYKGVLPLLNVAGLPVGSLTLAYRYQSNAAESGEQSTMLAVRNGLKVDIPSRAALFETGKTPKENYAQTLADAIMAAHPDLMRVSIHVAAPGAPIINTYVIGGKDLSSKHLPMIGAPDDDEDFLPLTTGKPSFLFVKKDGGFYKGLLPLYDVAGRQIGILLLGCHYRSKQGEPEYQQEMTLIRDQLKVHIPSRAALFQPAA